MPRLLEWKENKLKSKIKCLVIYKYSFKKFVKQYNLIYLIRDGERNKNH